MDDSIVFPIDSVRLQEAAAREDSDSRSILYDYLRKIVTCRPKSNGRFAYLLASYFTGEPV